MSLLVWVSVPISGISQNIYIIYEFFLFIICTLKVGFPKKRLESVTECNRSLNRGRFYFGNNYPMNRFDFHIPSWQLIHFSVKSLLSENLSKTLLNIKLYYFSVHVFGSNFFPIFNETVIQKFDIDFWNLS